MRYYPLLNRLLWMATVGGTATLTYAALTWSLAVLTALPAAFASLASYAVAAVLSYFGHRRLTFRSRRSHREAVCALHRRFTFRIRDGLRDPGPLHRRDGSTDRNFDSPDLHRRAGAELRRHEPARFPRAR